MTRTVVITGSSRGIGRGLAHEFLARDCNVVVTGTREASVASGLAALTPQHGTDRIEGVVLDVRDRASVQSCWDAAVSRFGSVDIWIANAGVSHPRRPLWELEASEIEAVVDTNVLGSLWSAHVALAGMQAQGKGVLYLMEGFGSGGEAADGMTAYGASKRGVALMRKALVKDLGKNAPVRVGALSPGMVATDMLRGDYDSQEAWEKASKIFNILGDRVETVTPWLVDKVLADDKQGTRIAWLTKRKAAGRFALAWRGDRDIFAEPATT